MICGYPKSGNTWLTRLIAEMLGCPVAGFWLSAEEKDVAIEGLDRASDFVCFKSHHTFEQLRHSFRLYGNGNEKIVYIYRDPRDVAVSASHYFKIRPEANSTYRLATKLPAGLRIYHALLQRHSHVIDTIVEGMISGTHQGHWLQVPWNEHVSGFLDERAVLSINYETLSQAPVETCDRICSFLEIEVNHSVIKRSVEAQSFAARKREFEKKGDQRKAEFMRSGVAGAWKSVLNPQQASLLSNAFADLLDKLGYETST